MARHTVGWVKIHRKIGESWIAEDAAALAIFDTLLRWANYAPSKKKDGREFVTLKPGQLITSADELARQLKLNSRTVLRKLNALEGDETIVQKVSGRGRIITIRNYRLYQGSDEGECRTVVPTVVIHKKKLRRKKKENTNTPLTPLGEPGVSKSKFSDVKEAIGILSSLFTAEPGCRPLKAALQHNAHRITEAYGIDVVRRMERFAWQSGIMGNLKWRPNVLLELAETAARDISREKLKQNSPSDKSHLRMVEQRVGEKNASEAVLGTPEALHKFDILIHQEIGRPLKSGLD